MYRNRYEVYGNLATAYHAIGRYEEAIYAYEIAVNKNNNMSTSNSTTDNRNKNSNTISSTDNSENNDSSTYTHNMHTTSSPNVVTLSNYALCLCTLSRYDEGLLILERAKGVCSTIEYDKCMGTIYGPGAISGIDSEEEAEIGTVPEIDTEIDSGKEGEGRVEIVNDDLLRAIKTCTL